MMMAWNSGDVLEVICADVDDEEAILGVVLQDLKESSLSNVKSNTINLRKSFCFEKMYMSPRAWYSGPKNEGTT